MLNYIRFGILFSLKKKDCFFLDLKQKKNSFFKEETHRIQKKWKMSLTPFDFSSFHSFANNQHFQSAFGALFQQQQQQQQSPHSIASLFNQHTNHPMIQQQKHQQQQQQHSKVDVKSNKQQQHAENEATMRRCEQQQQLNPHELIASTLKCASYFETNPLASIQLQYDCSAPIASNNPQNNECKLIDYRQTKVASFRVDGKELICLPQAFELFLKTLVGGLHTVYTKLKRLDIVPIVCNVEQV